MDIGDPELLKPKTTRSSRRAMAGRHALADRLAPAKMLGAQPESINQLKSRSMPGLPKDRLYLTTCDVAEEDVLPGETLGEASARLGRVIVLDIGGDFFQ